MSTPLPTVASAIIFFTRWRLSSSSSQCYGGKKPLQALLRGARDGLGHGVAILVGQLRQQPRQVALQGGLGFGTTKAHLEGRQKGVQLGQQIGTGMNIQGYPSFF